MNINELRKLIEEVESGWEWRDLTNTNWDCWNEEFASEQMPRIIDALHEFEKVLQANPEQQITIEEAERRAMQALSRAAARVLELRRRREAEAVTAEVVEQAEPEDRERLVHASKAMINAAKSKTRDQRPPNRFS